MSISSSSVLVELNLRVWPANKLDREATDTVTSTNGAGRRAAKVSKDLMAGTRLRRDIAEYAAACRVWHNSRTVPWSDRGPRLLPTSLFIDYKTELNIRENTFNKMVADFVTNYPALVQIAQNNAEGLGKMFKQEDYPSVEEVAFKFSFHKVFSPVPESGHFTVDIETKELEELKQEYEGKFNERLAEAMHEPWERLHTALTAISTKLTDDDTAPEKTKRYHDTLITNAQSLCGLLTHLNITKDPTLEQARRQLEMAMAGADIEDIKESPAVRADVKSKVDAILKQYDKW